MKTYLEVLKKYAVFNGRAPRKEYWMFTLISVIVSLVIGLIGGMFGDAGSVLPVLYALAVLIPSLAVTVRRLHDTSRTGWWVLIAIIPFIGFIVLLIFMLLDSTGGENKYGPNPKGMAGPSAPMPQQAM